MRKSGKLHIEGFNMKLMPSKSVVLATAIAFALETATGVNGVRAEPVTTAATVSLAINAAAGELRRLANDTAAATDQVLFNEIEHARTSLLLLLPKLNEAVSKGTGDANDAANAALRQAVGILSNLHADGSELGNFASAKLNMTLAQMSADLADLPFIDVTPAVFAVSPMRLDADQRTRRVRVFGYLPGAVNKDVKITIDGASVDAVRGAGGSISFILPPQVILREEAQIVLGIDAVEHYGFGLFWKTHSFHETLVVGKKLPFDCDVIDFVENPNYLQSIKATNSAAYDATTQGGDNKPNEHRLISAEDLFVATMGDAARQFDLSTVRIDEAGAHFAMYGECRGQGPGGTARVVAGGKALEIDLSAPSLGDRVITGEGFLGLGVTICHAGGTHAHLDLTPAFSAARKDTPQLIAKSSTTYKLGAAGLEVARAMPTAAPWSLHVKCAYQDGSESWSTRTMVVTEREKQDIARGVSVRFVDGRLLIEPIDPLKLDALLNL
jgi:hypothetical protein